MNTKIFISYRRSDSRGDARSIHQWLQERFGREALFIDVDTIRKGRDFVEVLHDALSKTSVLICVIGPHWLDALDESGKRRIDNEMDFVRLEIAAALKRKIPIVPVRIEAQVMPNEADLPDELKPLAKRMAAIVRHESFAQDMEQLELELGMILRPARYIDRLKEKLQRHKRLAAVCCACIFLTALASIGEIASFLDSIGAATTAMRYGSTLQFSLSQIDRAQTRIQQATIKIKYEAEQALSEDNRVDGLNRAWTLAQLVAAAPDITADFRERYLRYIGDKFDTECLCFVVEALPNTAASAWVLMAADSRNEAIYSRVLKGILQAQSSKGWWSIALDAVPDDSNASIYATSLVVMALASYRNTRAPEAPELTEISDALDRAVTWLVLQVPRAGQGWHDYPGNQERSILNPMFGAMWITAIAAARPDSLTRDLALRAVDTTARLSDPTLYFSSDAYITRKHDVIHIDKFRHVPFPWEAMGLAAAYPHLGLEDRGRILLHLAEVLEFDFENDAFKRHEWILGEEVFMLRRILGSRTK